jgi:Mn2+/Fe2+ NRAMP family transporter
MFVPYRRYSQFLKWITLALLAYVAVILLIRIDWRSVALGPIWPRVESAGAVTTVVAIFGTTISPYLFFWQSSQEVEEIQDKKDARPLLKAPRQAPRELRRISFDTLAGMAVSNLVAIAIIIATAATFHDRGRPR